MLRKREKIGIYAQNFGFYYAIFTKIERFMAKNVQFWLFLKAFFTLKTMVFLIIHTITAPFIDELLYNTSDFCFFFLGISCLGVYIFCMTKVVVVVVVVAEKKKKFRKSLSKPNKQISN